MVGNVVYLHSKERILVLCEYKTVDDRERKGKKRRRRVHGVGVNITNLYNGRRSRIRHWLCAVGGWNISSRICTTGAVNGLFGNISCVFFFRGWFAACSGGGGGGGRCYRYWWGKMVFFFFCLLFFTLFAVNASLTMHFFSIFSWQDVCLLSLLAWGVRDDGPGKRGTGARPGSPSRTDTSLQQPTTEILCLCVMSRGIRKYGCIYWWCLLLFLFYFLKLFLFFYFFLFFCFWRG